MKKVLALVLAVVLAFGMSSVAFAAVAKADGIADVALGVSEPEVSGQRDSTSYDSLLAKGDTQVKIWLDNTNIKWKDGVAPTGKITSSMLTNVSVKKSVSKGSDVIRDVELKYDNTKGAYVRVRFVEDYVNTGSKDFEMKIYLAWKNTRNAASEIVISGTMENQKETIYEGDDYFNLSEGTMAEAEDYIKSIEWDLGNGVKIHGKAFEGKKYYGISKLDISTSDEAVVAKYPEIDAIYTLKTVNLKGAGDIVEFEIDDTYYVYNAEGKYIGTTAQRLAYSDKYYMATKKIDMDLGGEEVPEEEPGEAPTTETPENPPMGGDNGAPNANDNPGTGANGFVGVAVAMGLVSLAAAAVSKKK